MATKGDKFTDREREELRVMVRAQNPGNGPRAESAYQAAWKGAQEDLRVPAGRRKWRKALKAWRKGQAQAAAT